MSTIQELTIERARAIAAADEAQVRVCVARGILTQLERDLRQAKKAAEAAMNRLSDALEDSANGR